MPRKKKEDSDKPEKAPRAPRARSSEPSVPKRTRSLSDPDGKTVKLKDAGAVKKPRASSSKVPKVASKPLTPGPPRDHEAHPQVRDRREGRAFMGTPVPLRPTKAVLLARDPYWIYAFWEVTTDKQNAAKAFLGDEHSSSSMVLRVFQSPGPEGGEPLFLYDVEVRPFITSWYLNVHRPDREYFIEIVQRSPSGRVFLHARSNVVTTPRDFATPSPEKKWHVPETLAKYFRKETRSQQVGISSAEVAEGSPFERFPSGKGL